MVRERIESKIDCVEDKVLDTTAKAMVNGTMAVRRLSAKKYGKAIMTVAAMAVLVGAMAITAAAAGEGGSGSGADKTFGDIATTIMGWVKKIGALVIVFGAINAGIGIANQDDAGRNRGFMTMAGGAVLVTVIAVLDYNSIG